MKKLLVLGAGYANLAFLKNLDSKFFRDFQVTLISKESYHYTSVLLHEVAAGENKRICYNLNEILPFCVQVIKDEVCEICEGYVIGKKEQYDYDYLVVGLGFSSDSFGIKGVEEYAIPLVDFNGAIKIRESLSRQFDRYQNGDKDALRIAVCGAGFSGIELVASLCETLKKEANFRNIPQKEIQLISIEAMSKIIPMFPDELIEKATRKLKESQVDFALECKILEIKENAIVVERNGKQDEIPVGLSIWTAGVKGNSVIQNSQFFVSSRSRVEVNEYLQPIGQTYQNAMKNIYVIGDCAVLKDPISGRFYPPTAQISIQEGVYLARAFQNRVYGGRIAKFTYHSKGTVCSLGSSDAIGLVGDKKISGKSAIFLKRLIEKKWMYYLFGLRGLFK